MSDEPRIRFEVRKQYDDGEVEVELLWGEHDDLTFSLPSAVAHELRRRLEGQEPREIFAAATKAVESALRGWEKELEQKHELHGRPVTREVVEGMPLIRLSADIARARMVATAAIAKAALIAARAGNPGTDEGRNG